MTNKFIYFFPTCIVLLISIVMFYPQISESGVSGIPPTPAFSKITPNDQAVFASNFDDTLFMNFTGSLSVEKVGTHEFTVSLDPITCPPLQGLKGVDENGFLFCGAI